MALVEIESRHLAALLDDVRFAAADESGPKQLRAVHLHREGASLVAVASDGHRLVRLRAPVRPHAEDRGDFQCTLGLSAADSFADAARRCVNATQLQTHSAGGRVYFDSPEISFSGDTRDGFPTNYSVVIPSHWAATAIVRPADLLVRICRMIFLDLGRAAGEARTTFTVRLALERRSLVLGAPDDRTHVLGKTRARVSGTAPAAGIAVDYLASVLMSASPFGKLAVHLPESPTKPIGFTSEGNPHWFAQVSPVQLVEHNL